MEENNATGNFLNIDALEVYTIKCLLTNQTLLSKFISSMKSSYFHTTSNLTIFKIIRDYYHDYQIKIPNDELPIRLESILPKSNSEDKNKELRQTCLKLADDLYNGEPINTESAGQNIMNFISQRAGEEAINKLVLSMTNTDNSDNFKERQFNAIFNCVNELKQSTNICIDDKEPFNLADMSRLHEIRKEALGDEDNNRIIKFYIKSMNDIMQYDGVAVGSIVCVVATPGSGKSTFLMNQGLCSASQGLRVAHCFIGDMEYLDGLIRYYTCYTETENSRIMIANKLLEKDIKLRKRALKKYKEGSDQFLFNERLIKEKEAQLKQNQEIDEQLEREGKKKLVLTSRQMAQFSESDLLKLLSSDEKFMKIAQNVDIFKYASAEITMDALKEEIYSRQRQKGIHYDVIIVDYDGNLKQPADSMYESGGIIYDQAKNLAQINHSVVFMASQPKQSFWRNELIPIEACAESSKKQMVIDMLITIGRPEGVNTGIRKIYVPKNRRGKENEIFHAKLNGETGFMYEIFQDEYDALKKQGYDPTLVLDTATKKKQEQMKQQENNNNNQANNVNQESQINLNVLKQ